MQAARRPREVQHRGERADQAVARRDGPAQQPREQHPIGLGQRVGVGERDLVLVELVLLARREPVDPVRIERVEHVGEVGLSCGEPRRGVGLAVDRRPGRVAGGQQAQLELGADAHRGGQPVRGEVVGQPRARIERVRLAVVADERADRDRVGPERRGAGRRDARRRSAAVAARERSTAHVAGLDVACPDGPGVGVEQHRPAVQVLRQHPSAGRERDRVGGAVDELAARDAVQVGEEGEGAHGRGFSRNGTIDEEGRPGPHRRCGPGREGHGHVRRGAAVRMREPGRAVRRPRRSPAPGCRSSSSARARVRRAPRAPGAPSARAPPGRACARARARTRA